MKYAKLSETKTGDVLIADGGFTCVETDEMIGLTKETESAHDFLVRVFGLPEDRFPAAEVFSPVLDTLTRPIKGRRLVFVKMMSHRGNHDNGMAELIAAAVKTSGRYFKWNSHDHGPKRRSFYVDLNEFPSLDEIE